MASTAHPLLSQSESLALVVRLQSSQTNSGKIAKAAAGQLSALFAGKALGDFLELRAFADILCGIDPASECDPLTVYPFRLALQAWDQPRSLGSDREIMTITLQTGQRLRQFYGQLKADLIQREFPICKDGGVSRGRNLV